MKFRDLAGHYASWAGAFLVGGEDLEPGKRAPAGKTHRGDAAHRAPAEPSWLDQYRQELAGILSLRLLLARRVHAVSFYRLARELQWPQETKALSRAGLSADPRT
jgi:hypothetical protein